MTIQNTPAAALAKNGRLQLGMAILLSLFTLQCSDDSGTNPPVVKELVEYIQPAAGKHYKLAEPFPIIAIINYDSIAANLNYSASEDSGKTWELFVGSSKLKSGKAVRDTVLWAVLEGGLVKANQGYIVRAVPYGSKTISYQSKMFYFDP